MSLVKHPNDIRLGIIGCTVGNGHPYSWSAIFNGYDRDLMTRECPFSGIPAYLNKQPPHTVAVPGAKVTHIHCIGDGGFSAEHVARCSLIPHVVSQPADMIGQVDAVIIATDIGAEHVARARPFVDAGLPVFIDKPLVDNLSDLRVFQDWVAHGRPILSSSCMRYAKEFMPYQLSTAELGPLRFAGITSCGSLEAYGIHALEGIYPILGPGFLSARNIGARERNIIHLTHRSGIDAIVVVTSDMFGGFGCLELCGTVGSVSVKFADKFFSFKRQMEAFIDYLRTGVRPFAFEETAELMRLLVASIESREAGGREIRID